MIMVEFLIENGIPFDCEPPGAAPIHPLPAAGEVSEESLTRWIRDNWSAAVALPCRLR
jgi:death on curing protein